MEMVKSKMNKTEIVNEQLNGRDRRTKEAAVSLGRGVSAKRDINRLLAPTKAFESSKIAFEDLENSKGSNSAHSMPIAYSGRDLQYFGRATPSWISKAAM